MPALYLSLDCFQIGFNLLLICLQSCSPIAFKVHRFPICSPIYILADFQSPSEQCPMIIGLLGRVSPMMNCLWRDLAVLTSSVQKD